LQVHPDCVQCVVHLGVIDQFENQLESAAARYRAAQTLSPQFAGASLRLAQVSRMAGAAADAEGLLTDVERSASDAIASGDETSARWWQLAAAASIRGNRGLAIERYRQAVAAGRRDAWDRWDPLLSAIHGDPEFLALLQPFEQEHRAAAPVAGRLQSALGDVERHRSH
jgi:hypothetical protein